jgi:hypothetical protein
MAHYEGVSRATDPNAGFRAAAQAAVDKYKDENGAPKAGEPVHLDVVSMSVKVQNPIHEYIVVLGRGG